MKPIGRLLAVLALVTLVQTPGSSVSGSNAGKDFPRCIQACNAVYAACGNQCTTDCTAMFPGSANKPARDACITACKNVCAVDKAECKRACNVNRPPITPEEP